MKILAYRISSTMFLLSACVSVPQLSGATVDTGSINVTGPAAPGTFSLSGTGFTATGFFDLGNWSVESCRPCAAGTLLSVNGSESGSDFGPGSATIGGIFTNVLWGDLNAARGSIFGITGPPIQLNHGAGIYTSTFSFAGELCGTTPPSLSSVHPCTVHLTALTGNGRVSVVVANQALPNTLFVTGATYTFDTVLSGVPEPSTIVLVASTAAMIFLGRRKMRGHKIL